MIRMTGYTDLPDDACAALPPAPRLFAAPVGRRALLGLGGAGVLALSGCALGGAAPRLYSLKAVRPAPATLPQVHWQLQVDEPGATAGLDSERIALRDAPTALDYFAGVAWTDRAPQMIQGLLVESFENTSRITAVARDSAGLRADVLLKTELRAFEAEYANTRRSGAPQVRVRLNAKLLRMPRRTIEDTENFEQTVPARSERFDDIITAFDTALGHVLARCVGWTLTRRVGKS